MGGRSPLAGVRWARGERGVGDHVAKLEWPREHPWSGGGGHTLQCQRYRSIGSTLGHLPRHGPRRRRAPSPRASPPRAGTASTPPATQQVEHLTGIFMSVVCGETAGKSLLPMPKIGSIQTNFHPNCAPGASNGWSCS
jgi:hypothetical protein